MDVFCSTIIPTMGRDSLAQAVYSVLDQQFDGATLEVIVVNDSGKPLPQADWQADERVRVIATMRRERCVARNAGAAMARGRYLHFLDDDDIILPGAMAAFWQLYQTSQPKWMYGSYQTVTNEGEVVEVIRPTIRGNVFALLIAGEAIPFQTSLLDSSLFHAVGAFDPHPDIVGVEDRDVGRRMALADAIAYTPQVVAQIRIGQVGSTTNWAVLGERDRWGREKALRIKGARARLQNSAQSSFLRGRVSRAYVASALWNVQNRNYFIAASRLCAAVTMGIAHFLSAQYWQGFQAKIS